MKYFLANVFEKKKDRDDFFIALLVISLFFGLFTYLLGGDVEDSAELAVIALDSDGDGVLDEDDHCPALVGLVSLNGCPEVIVQENDLDGDGLIDKLDACPEIYAPLTSNGCPSEEKSSDEKKEAGLDLTTPVVVPVLTGGGVISSGDLEEELVLIDSDKDGVIDAEDNCPQVAGLVELNGCPKIEIKEKEKLILNEALIGVQFHTAKASLKDSSKSSLSKVVGFLKSNPSYKLMIVGHTDSDGEEEANLALSKSRAASCKVYLVTQGIDGARVSIKGKGESTPIASNEHSSGKAKNRRVEFLPSK